MKKTLERKTWYTLKAGSKIEETLFDDDGNITGTEVHTTRKDVCIYLEEDTPIVPDPIAMAGRITC